MVLGPTSISVKTLAVCTSLLYIKFIVTARLQAVNTFLAGGRPPEDVVLVRNSKKEIPKQNYGLVQKEKEDDRTLRAKLRSERWKRIIGNDVESIPLALAVFAVGILTEANEKVQVGAMVTFTTVRILHTYAYAKEMQPHRSLLWLGGVVSVIVGAGNMLVSVFAN
ncbi:hypothetical protein Poli38472_001072 [Pythium oligandrum]|uniref:Microsomal glutathione S-transferase 1 n=1 Tax=Pythium oligandrum TaxID=41045 RepID=A0A8K1CSA5_PYTOL|nr:hypothetical protein Poli38472_001072 [Pythium oligandrum]|eukprot:TMW68916.1 hypothetical protein Poli38472_001072 [Pythium oligandrum]